MAWEAKVTRTERQGDQLTIVVSYTNGTLIYDQNLVTSGSQNSSWLGNQVYKTISDLSDLDGYQQTITVGAVAPQAPTPSKKELAGGTYQKLIGEISQINQLLSYGVVGTADVPDLDTLKTKAKEIFLDR